LDARGKQRGGFEGLPIPAAATLLVAYTMLCFDLWGELRYVRFLVIMMIVASALMVSSIPYEDKPTRWRTPLDRIKFTYIFVAIVALLIDLSKTLFWLILIYVLSGVGREVFDLVRAGTGHGERRRRSSGRPGPPEIS
ncbi:MAG TPA: hypothetical protein VM118_09590, partial [Acidobacteriota bacterium]|nr:hypothetical protein [Acidobacteriota bacterium]